MSEQALTKYAEQLSGYSKLATGIMIVIFIVFLIMLLVCVIIGAIKERSIKITLGIFLLLPIVVYVTSVLPYRLDIKQQSYETYQGEFYVEKYYFATRSGTYILLKTENDSQSIRYKAPGNLEGIEDDTYYNGEFVIAKHSKTLVDMSVW